MYACKIKNNKQKIFLSDLLIEKQNDIVIQMTSQDCSLDERDHQFKKAIEYADPEVSHFINQIMIDIDE